MTTMAGKGPNYVVGREAPNKEPPVSKFVVEKLYRVHRRRVLNVAPVVDCHSSVFHELGKDTSWKKGATDLLQQRIARENESIYGRIAKRENEESQMAKSTREHNERVDDIKSHSKRLKEASRLRKVVKIRRENEMLLHRIERARPEYTIKSIRDWYKHHENFKDGRRADPTAGHIMKGMRGLLPGSLPPMSISGGSNSDYGIDSLSMSSRNSFVSATLTPSKSDISVSSNDGSSIGTYSVSVGSYTNSPLIISMTSLKDTSLLSNSEKSIGIKKKKKVNKPKRKTLDSMPETSISMHKHGHGHLDHSSSHRTRTGHHDDGDGSFAQDSMSQVSMDESLNMEGSFDDDDKGNYNHHDDIPATTSNDNDDNMTLLVSKHVPIPFDSNHCCVKISTPNEPDGNLYIQVYPTDESKLLYERVISVERAEEITRSSRRNISQVVDDDDVQTLRAMLVKLFDEIDTDKNGYLTYDEFEKLMEQVSLGISSTELRFVIQEADENNNGVIDYVEYVPLAVDLIQSFRARNRAKIITNESNADLDERVRHLISADTIEAIVQIAYSKITEVDVQRTGTIRPSELRKCLSSMSGLGLTELELNLTIEQLPRDSQGKIFYRTLSPVLRNSRHVMLRYGILKDEGVDLLKHLLNDCYKVEWELREEYGNDEVSTGKIPFKKMFRVLSDLKYPALSHLQILVILSDSGAGNSLINYFNELPLIVKTIEYMFDPRSLRMRAELIEKADLSSEKLLKILRKDGFESEEFRNNIQILLKSNDLDHDSKIDEQEFINFIEGFDFQLKSNEIRALFVQADKLEAGWLTFDAIVEFVADHIAKWEKDKHVRLMGRSLHKHGPPIDSPVGGNKRRSVVKASFNLATDKPNTVAGSTFDFVGHLSDAFAIADESGTGFLNHNAFVQLIKELRLPNITPFQINCMLSEMHTDAEGKIDYHEFIPVCADLLKTFEAKEIAEEDRKAKEVDAAIKATNIVMNSYKDIVHIGDYIKLKIRHIQETIEDPKVRFKTLQDALRNKHSGLSASESNALLHNLFSSEIGGINPNAHTELHFRPMANSPVQSPRGTDAGEVKKKTYKKSRTFKMRESRDFTCTEPPLTEKELLDGIFEARKSSVMHSLLHNVDQDEINSYLTHKLTTEVKRLAAIRVHKGSRGAKLLEEEENLIPVSSVFHILENSKKLRLHRSHVLGILSWAQCYNPQHTHLFLDKFVEFATEVAHKIMHGEMLEQRVNALHSDHVNDLTLMNGLTEEELDEYYTSLFTYAQSDEGEVTEEQFFEIVKNSPKLKLSNSEVAAVTAGFPRTSNSKILWPEFITWAHRSLTIVCRERLLGKAVISSLKQDSGESYVSAEEKRAAILLQIDKMGILSSRFIELVKVKYVGEVIVVALPGDVTTRRSTITTKKDEQVDTAKHDDDVVELVRATRMITIQTPPPPLSPISKISTPSGAVNRKQFPASNLPQEASTASGVDKRIAVLMRIFAVEKTLSKVLDEKFAMHPINSFYVPIPGAPLPSQLVCNIISVDGSFVVSQELPFTLPSIGNVDRESARTFARNVCDSITIIMDPYTNKLSIKSLLEV